MMFLVIGTRQWSAMLMEQVAPDVENKIVQALEMAKTIFWNGPMGVFEFEKFSLGTEGIARKVDYGAKFA